MSDQHCPEGTCHGCYGCECLDNPDCFVCNDRRETRKIERERIIALLTDTYGEDYADVGVVGTVIALIKGENE